MNDLAQFVAERPEFCIWWALVILVLGLILVAICAWELGERCGYFRGYDHALAYQEQIDAEDEAARHAAEEVGA